MDLKRCSSTVLGPIVLVIFCKGQASAQRASLMHMASGDCPLTIRGDHQ